MRSRYAACAATKSPIASPPNLSSAARRAPRRRPPRRRPRAPRPRRRRSARRARRRARPSTRSTEPSGFISVGSGFIAARTTISSPFDMPASMPPARFDVRRFVGADLVVRLRAAQLREREPVADLDALDRLDPHHRGGQPRVEAVLLRRVRAEPGRHAGRAHLDEAADRVALGARLVDPRRAAPPRRPSSRRPRCRSWRAAPSRPRRPRRARPCAAPRPARASCARRRGRTSAPPPGRRGRAAAASPASSPCPDGSPSGGHGAIPHVQFLWSTFRTTSASGVPSVRPWRSPASTSTRSCSICCRGERP